MAVRYYTKGSTAQVAPNFRAWEFACGGRGCGGEFPLEDQLVAYLQKIRDHFQKPVNISSGYRCPEHNAQVGGSPNSYHLKGMAADIWVEGLLHEPRVVAQYAESIGVPGIGLYENSKGQYFVHIDTRSQPLYWYSHEEILVPTFREPSVVVTGKEFPVGVRVLRYGMKGRDVKALQLLLAGYGYPCTADGSFGPETKKAMVDYQQANSLETDGVCGHDSWHNILGRD